MTVNFEEGMENFSQLVLTTHNLALADYIDRLQDGRLTIEEGGKLVDDAQITERGSDAYQHEPDATHDKYAEGSAPRKKLKTPFMYLATSICKYANRDPDFEKRLRETTKEINASKTAIMSKGNVGALALFSLAEALCKHVPLFESIGVAALAGILLIIGAIGMDAFCAWVKDNCPEC